MATIKAIKKKTNSKVGLKNSIEYITNKEKTLDGKLIDGFNCTTSNVYKEFIIVKELKENEKGVMAHHFTQNFNPLDNISPKKALELGRELAENTFKDYQVIIATHIDKKHIHNHLIVNSVNYKTGLKLVNNNQLLEKIKAYSDMQCKREGLSIIDRNKEKSVEFQLGIYDKNKYEVIMQGIKGKKKSYVLNTVLSVDRALDNAKTKEEFIENMAKYNFKVNWSEQRKYITFEDGKGNKVRNINLQKTFNDDKFSKEGIIEELRKNKQIYINTKKIKSEKLSYNKIKLDIEKIKLLEEQKIEISKTLQELKGEKQNIGIFKFKKKKEISDKIECVENSLKIANKELNKFDIELLLKQIKNVRKDVLEANKAIEILKGSKKNFKLRNNIEHKSKETIKDVSSIKEKLKVIRDNSINKKVRNKTKIKEMER